MPGAMQDLLPLRRIRVIVDDLDIVDVRPASQLAVDVNRVRAVTIDGINLSAGLDALLPCELGDDGVVSQINGHISITFRGSKAGFSSRRPSRDVIA